MPPLLQDALIESPLRVEQTVPRTWVRRRSLDNVLVTEVRACGDRFICAGRLPTAHRFFNDAGRRPQDDILFYTELSHQASLAVCHAFLNVGQDDVFIVEGSHAAITDAAWKVSCEEGEAVAIEVRVQDMISRKNNAVSRMVTEHTMSIGAQHVFRGTGVFTVQPSALFERLRRLSAGRTAAALFDAGTSMTEPRTPYVPRATGDNIAISPPRRGHANAIAATVVVDRAHPYFFDRDCNYVPSTLLLEACAQLASSSFLATTGIEPLGISDCTASFTQFVEPGLPVVVAAHVGLWTRADRVPPAVFLNISQQDTLCGTATMHLAVPSGR